MPYYTWAFDKLIGKTGAVPSVGDIVFWSYYRYTVTSVDAANQMLNCDQNTAYVRVSLRGATGATGPEGPGVSDELRAALVQLADKVAYIDDQGQKYYNDLYNALYNPPNVAYITAVFNQGTTKVYTDTPLDDLKPMLTVFGFYDNNTSQVLTNYTLTGTLSAGTSTETVTALGKTTTFDVLVTGLSSISAVYTQGGTVYTHDDLDSLKTDLVVTALYSDGTSEVLSADDYTLSGTLTAGTSTITVAYSGKTTTFTVTVTAGVPSTYTMYDYIHAVGSNTVVNVTNAMWIALKQYANLNALSCEFAVLRGSGFATSGPAVFGRRSASGALSSFAFYPKDTELGYHLHGDEGTNPPGFTTDVVNIVKYTNTSESPSSLQVNDNTPAFITWVNNNTLNLAPVLLMNPVNDTKDNLNVFCQLGYIKFYDLSGNLVGHYFPVVRNSDNRIGVYDVVEQVFYTTLTASYSTIGNTYCMYEVGNWS